MNKKSLYILLTALMALTACEQSAKGPLPKIGNKEVIGTDTIYHTIPDFSFINQEGATITNKDLSNHIYVSDFFFTNCPSICPLVKKQMLRIYDKYKNEPMVKLVSHTIDPVRDTQEKLKKYATALGADSEKWLFLTGDKEALYDIADAYFVPALEDPDAPGGFDHSGKIILVDKNRHVRAFGEGTEPDDVTELLKDIDRLIAEYASDN